MMNQQEIYGIIIKARKALSFLGLIIIKHKRKKGFSEYSSTYNEYRLLLSNIENRFEIYYLDSNFQKLALELNSVLTAVGNTRGDINSTYTSISLEENGIDQNIQKQIDIINSIIFNIPAVNTQGLLTPIVSTLIGNTLTLTAKYGNEIKWRIGTVVVTVASPQIKVETPASDNYFRQDWLALSLTGFEIIQGVETLDAGILPDLPVNTIGLFPINIYGASIVATEPPEPIDITAPSWVVYGLQPFGKYGNGATVPFANSAYEQYKEAWTNVAPPNYLAPLATLTSNQGTSGLEIGESKSISLTLSFNQRNGGAETSRIIRKNGVDLGGTTDTIVVSASAISYQGSISYEQGAVLNNQAGIPDSTGRINAGTVNSNTITYVGSYFNFYGVGSIATNSAQVRALASKTTSNVFTLTIPAGQTQASFAYPATKADISDSSVKYVEGFNSNVGNTFTKSLFDVNDAGGNPIAYKIYAVVLPAPETGTVTYNVTLP